MRWGGSASRRERAKWAPVVAAGSVLCIRCGRPIRPNPNLPAQGWHPDHWPIRYEDGGRETHPAHARCNTQDGGRRGAQITNAKRRARTTVVGRLGVRSRNIRGV